MSIIGIHIHLHDDVLAKFGASLVDGVLAAMQRVSSKVTSKGRYEKYERRYHQAVKNMALMKRFLTPEQAAEIRLSLLMCVIHNSFTLSYCATDLLDQRDEEASRVEQQTRISQQEGAASNIQASSGGIR